MSKWILFLLVGGLTAALLPANASALGTPAQSVQTPPGRGMCLCQQQGICLRLCDGSCMSCGNYGGQGQ